ncbi:hypothetical protein J7E98_07200 [Streptomyces sp. ISL-86]|nr:hypothetical protein [Streptomyces sp. ISL-86]
MTLLLFREDLGGLAPGVPVDPVIDLVAEGMAGRLEMSEGRVLLQEIRIRGQQIGLRDPHRRLGSVLGFRVGRQTSTDRQPVMPRDLDDLRIADRDVRDVRRASW